MFTSCSLHTTLKPNRDHITQEPKSPDAMLKRKRDDHAPPSSPPTGSEAQRRGEVEEKLVHGKKMLNRALKTAKGFEWQKLVKRIGHAKEKGEEGVAEVARLERELKVLKVCHDVWVEEESVGFRIAAFWRLVFCLLKRREMLIQNNRNLRWRH